METSVFSYFSANNMLLENYPFRVEAALEAFLLENKEILQVGIYDGILGLNNQVSCKKKDGKGRVDILVSYSKSDFALVEIKNESLNNKHFNQLNEYFENLCLYPSKEKEEEKDLLDIDINNSQWFGILVGPDIDLPFLKEVQEGNLFIKKNGVDVPLAVIVLKRYKGSGQNFVVSDVYTSMPKKRKEIDKTRYLFKGKKCGRGRFLLEMFQDYVKRPEINSLKDMDSILSIFPYKDEVLVDFDMKCIEDKERQDAGKWGVNYFTKSTEAVCFKDGHKYASLYWLSLSDMKYVEEAAKKMKYPFQPIPG
jgi:hypothetical protein